ncbi:unnamed protein product [Alopecurus aequalis]
MALCVVFFLAVALAAAGGGEAALVEHTFVVSQIKMHHLCKDTLVTVVNGQLPGPAIEVTEGDSVAVNVINKSPHAVTIHCSSKIIPAVSPEMPGYDKGATSFYFHGNLTSLPHPFPRSVPASVDERLVMVTDMGYICKEGGSACGSVVARMNNISFQLPTETSLLQAHYNNNMSSTINLLREFPRSPPKIVFNQGTTMKATSLRRVRYNTTLEIVFQGPPEVFSFPNPMHLHGHDFFILAQGLGKYDAEKHVQTYNLVDPPMRNMALIPRFGWIAIRFVANNPGVWLLHCHIEQHVSTGMAMALVVDDGPTLDTALPPPPANYPICDGQSNKVAYK